MELAKRTRLCTKALCGERSQTSAEAIVFLADFVIMNYGNAGDGSQKGATFLASCVSISRFPSFPGKCAQAYCWRVEESTQGWDATVVAANTELYAVAQTISSQ